MHSAQFAPGVTKVQQPWWDEFEGTPADMIAAGLVKLEELPGVGDNGRYMMTFAADGQRLTRGCSRKRGGSEGYRQIRTVSRGRVRMIYRISEAEGMERARARRAAYQQREDLARVWPFPVCMGVPC